MNSNNFHFSSQRNIDIIIATITPLLPASRAGRFFSNISIQSSLVTYIMIVSAIYNYVIHSSWIQPIPEFIYNNILHVITPLLYVLRWIIYIPKGTLKWIDSIKWLIFPFIYLLYSLIRGRIVNGYLYFSVDLREIDYKEASRNISLVLLLFLVIGLTVIFTDHRINKTYTNSEI